MSILEQLDRDFPVRCREEEREAFRAFLVERAESLGFSAHVEENGRFRHKNVVVGDPEHAVILFVAAQDTPVKPLLPEKQILKPLPVYALQQLLHVCLYLIPAILVLLLAQLCFGNAQLSWALFLVCYLGFLLYKQYGKPRQENRAITAAPALLLMLMEQLPEQAKDKVAFLFADASYHGRGGAKAYAASHEQVAYTRLTVNVDAPLSGDEIVWVARPLAEKCTGYRALLRYLREAEGRTVTELPNRWTVAQTDQKFFKCGVELTSASREHGGIYVTDRDCHQEERMEILCQAILAFLTHVTTSKDTTKPYLKPHKASPKA